MSGAHLAGAGLGLGGLAGSAAAQGGDIDISSYEEMSIGSEDAPVTIIEYASLTCPHCATFHVSAYPKLKRNYIDTGKARMIFREVYFDRFGLWAGMLARCGGRSKYFPMIDLILKRQKSWSSGETPLEVVKNLKKLGKIAGMTEERMEECLQDSDMAQVLIKVYETNAEKDSIRGTPSFLVNGKLYTNMSYADFAEIIDDELGG